MITCKPSSEHPLHWKKLFAKSYIGAKEFSHLTENSLISDTELDKINSLFPIQISREYLENHPISGPVLRQYLPDAQELLQHSDDSIDPVGDNIAALQPGVIKKYKHRVLLITNNTCPIHCRYCFRKDFSYPASHPRSHQFKDALAYCSQDDSIHEVILSGGDPLSLEDDLLSHLFRALEKIPHIRTLRLHTKFPSVFPQRITPDLLTSLTECTLNKVIVFHINHPDEINESFCDVVQKIKRTNTTTLNQSVLLKNVNDDSKVLIDLSHKLFSTGILPYYLHKLDSARGTHHFRVSEQKADQIMQQMKVSLPGYLVPKLAREIAGQESKSY